MNTMSETSNSLSSQDTCNIVVIYDGDATRARALSACDYLVKQFWEDVELDFHWWRTDFLNDAELSSVAATNAVESDFFIICSSAGERLSLSLERWFASWLNRRRDRLGALIDLGTVRNGKIQPSAPMQEQFLREVCRRGSFDYLTSFAEDEGVLPAPVAGRIHDDGRGEERPPTHFGLNE